MQFAQLLLVDRARRLREQILRTLRLREGDHVADRVGAGHHRDNAVQAERDAAVRGRAILQGVQQEAELGARFFITDLQGAEHLALHFFAVDPHRAATDFPAVEHHVVGLGDALARIGFQVFQVLVLRTRERVVHGHPARVFLVVLEHREVDHPQRLPGVFEQAGALGEVRMAHLQAQRAHGVVDDLGAVGAEEQDVAVLRAATLEDLGDGRVVQVLHDRRLQAVAALGHFVDLDPGQALGAVDLDELGVGVDVTPRQGSTARHTQRHHAAAFGVGRAGEHLEVDVFHGVGQLGELQLHAQVRLVRTEAGHRLAELHHRELGIQRDRHGVLEHRADHFFKQIADFLLAQERRFAVDLGEFGLAVSAQVFVAEALGDLVVAVEARHHQHLLEQLRRLRQREELAGVHARRHQVVARAFRRALGQHRRFDVDEALVVQVLAHFHRHLVAQAQVVLHLRAAQVQHAVRQARGFRQVVVIELERRRDGGVEHRQLMAQHLDLAAGQVRVGRAFRTRTHDALDLQAELVAHAFGHLEHLRTVRIAHHLHQTLAIAQVDEDHAAMVTPAMRPARQGDALAQQLFGDLTAILSTHLHVVVFREARRQHSDTRES